MMKAYRTSMILCVIAGLIVSNILLCGIIADLICLYWIKQKDPNVYFVVGFFALQILAIDFMSFRCGIIRKLFLRVTTTKTGILCYGFLIRKYEVRWSDVKSYGVASNMFAYPMIFISMEEEKNTKLRFQFEKYSRKRITMQVIDGTWEELSKYMPADMKRNIGNAIRTHSDRKFFR